jgi:hypothetical protein
MASTPSNIGLHRKDSFASFISKLSELQASHFDGRCANGHGNGGDDASPRQAQFGSAVASSSLNKLDATASMLKRGMSFDFHISDSTMPSYRRTRFGFFTPRKKSQPCSRIVKNHIESSRIGYVPSPLFQ